MILSGTHTNKLTPFISEWTLTASDLKIQLPLPETGYYNFTVDWGDKKTNHITSWNQKEVVHSYPREGTYTITITGTIRGWSFQGSDDKSKIVNILQWGDLDFNNSLRAFEACINLRITALDAPILAKTYQLDNYFRNCNSLGASKFNTWNTVTITSLKGTFMNSNIDSDLSRWVVVSLQDGQDMMLGVELSLSNYEKLLESWSHQKFREGIEINFGNSQYRIDSVDAKKELEDVYKWTITDGGLAN